MASEKQIEANRRNAQLSTGPATPEGKAAVAQNALRHGLRANKVLPGDPDRLQQLRDELNAEYQPQTFTEAVLVDHMAIALHKRIWFEELETTQDLAGDLTARTQAIWRRQAALDRAFHQALDKLRKLQQARRQPEPARPDLKSAEPLTAQPQPTSPANQPYRREIRPGLVFVGRPPEQPTPSS